MVLMPYLSIGIQLDAVGGDGLSGDAQEPAQRRTIDIGVQQPHPVALRRQGQRQIDRRGRFADTALARSHGDDGPNVRQQAAALGARGRTGVGGGGGRRRFLALGGQHHRCREHARHLVNEFFHLFAKRLQTRPALGIDLERKRHVAVLYPQPLDHSKTDDVLIALLVDDATKSVDDLLFGNFHHL